MAFSGLYPVFRRTGDSGFGVGSAFIASLGFIGSRVLFRFSMTIVERFNLFSPLLI